VRADRRGVEGRANVADITYTVRKRGKWLGR
jgi:hypothetical protein